MQIRNCVHIKNFACLIWCIFIIDFNILTLFQNVNGFIIGNLINNHVYELNSIVYVVFLF